METDLIKAMGGPAKLARLSGVKPPSVCDWRKNGIPPARCAGLEAALGGVFRRWQMRPKDWHLIWPELVNDPKAPCIPVSSAGARKVEGVSSAIEAGAM